MERVRETTRPFSIAPTVESAWARAAIGVAAPAVEWLLGLTTLGRMYTEATGPAVVDDFPERALAHLDIRLPEPQAGHGRFPPSGPLVIVANHPFGAADGLALLALVRSVRPDVKLLGNYVLQRIPELADLIIAVDPFGGSRARSTNVRMLRRAVDWTRRGGATIVFPAGEVSATRAADAGIVDGPWQRGVARLIRDTAATVVPVHFSGRNSRVFEWAGRISPRLRTALLPRELLARRSQSLTYVVGQPIPGDSLTGLPETDVLTTLRARTYGLGAIATTARQARPIVQAPIASARHTGLELAREVSRLPADRQLLTSGGFEVYCVTAGECPQMLDEIARLREIAFRAVGEGTGRAQDRDRFDEYYRHLVVWQAERQEVAGAYRLALTDEVARHRGPRGLYTNTLFRFGDAFLDRIGPALELGRSFVRDGYQRDSAALRLLWQGIGAFCVRHPRYRTLFGPVSISARYPPVTRDLIVSALMHQAAAAPYWGLAAPMRPYRSHTGTAAGSILDGPASAHALAAAIDPESRGVPVLLRQYLKLGAQAVTCSVDPTFASAVDALMVVALDRTPPHALNRYMTPVGAARFCAAGPAARQSESSTGSRDRR